MKHLNLTKTENINKAEEFSYQLSQVRYHLDQYRASLKEAVISLQKISSHAKLANECIKYLRNS